jgi:hypothetical protein
VEPLTQAVRSGASGGMSIMGGGDVKQFFESNGQRDVM